jgi:predicted DNA-binding transcriptional regulator YafY
MLLELLQSGGTRTVAELADRLGVEGRTVRRYVDQLIDLDIPVESVRGRYGGYRLRPGFRLPPLMLSDDEALAVLLGLAAGRRAGLTTTQDTAGETASAKIRRVLPQHIARRLDALLESLTWTDQPSGLDTPDTAVLLTVADAVRHRRPVLIRYADREGRRSERTLHAYGIVAHAGRWYVTGRDVRIGEERTLRLDRITDARTLPGSFEAPAGPDPAQRVLSAFATAEYRHAVTLRIHGTAGQIRARLPASVATLTEHESVASEVEAPGRWWRAELRVERLDWLPPVLASLDLPFIVERPDELRDLVTAFAGRLASYARQA